MAGQPQLHDIESATTHSAEAFRIALIGFGNFGQSLAETLVRQGHIVLAHSRSDYSAVAQSLGVSFFDNPDDLCAELPDVVLFCTSILSTQKALKSLPLHRLKRNTLFVDVLSVMEFPRSLFLQTLPSDFDIICTHLMFVPESGKNDWNGVIFVYDKVRVGADVSGISKCERFLQIFAREGCKMVNMGCAEYDKYAAGSQFITHMVGRVLEKLHLKQTPINTKGYEMLLSLVDNTVLGSFDWYCELFMFNKNSPEQLQRMFTAFDSLTKLLFQNMHGVIWKQLYSDANSPVQSFDVVSTSTSSQTSRSSEKLKIAIVGFGNFGQFLAKNFVSQGHTVLAYSRSNQSVIAQKLGISFFCDTDNLCEQQPDIVLFCTSIISIEQVLKSFPFQRLKQSTLFVDVLSVKEFPMNLFLRNLPPYFDILCTHPMFGPESGKHGWKGLPFVFEKVRVVNELRCNHFIDIFTQEGCRMVEMTCKEHDMHAAGSQFITHTMGRILEKMGLESTPINTREYESLLKLVQNTASDSFDLYYGLFICNENAMDQVKKLGDAFESLRMELLGNLHGIIGKQLI